MAGALRIELRHSDLESDGLPLLHTPVYKPKPCVCEASAWQIRLLWGS